MAYLILPVDQPVVWVPDSELSKYLAAGWTQATAAQVRAYHATDPYQGTQTAPPANLKDAYGNPLPPSTQHIHGR